MSARIRLYDRKRGDTVVFDGEPGMELMDFLGQHGNHWGRVDIGNTRLSGTFVNRYGYHGGHWWEFGQDNDWELLQHMLVPANPFFESA